MRKCNVVIPTIGKNGMVISLLNQLNELRGNLVNTVFLFDNGMPKEILDRCCQIPNVSIIKSYNTGIYQMWNAGIKLSLQAGSLDSIAIFNDDIQLINKSNWFEEFLSPFESDDVWATCANYDYQHDLSPSFKDVIGTFKDRGFAGFCFAVKSEAYIQGLPLFDERYEWWYGDDDFVHSVHKAGKRTTMSLNAGIVHINGGSQSADQYTPAFNAKVARDRDLYFSKWHRAVSV